MKRILSFSLLFALALTALPAQAASAEGPTPVLDQSFTTPGGASMTIPDGSNGYVAQTFTAGITGLLTAVNLDFTNSFPTNTEMSLEIFGVTNGVPNDTFYAQRFLMPEDFQAMNAGPLSYTIPVPSFVVKAGTQYAIELHYTAVPSGSQPQSVWSGATGDAYTGGSVFTGTSFNSWTPAAAGLDLHFRTYVVTGPIADLAISLVRAARHAKACQTFDMVFRLTNNGPETVYNVALGLGLWDQFDAISIGGTPVGTPHPEYTLAKGESVDVTATIKVTAFVPGESRKGLISGHVWSDDSSVTLIDPNPDNDYVEYMLPLIGRQVTSCP